MQGGSECSQRVRVTAFQAQQGAAAEGTAPNPNPYPNRSDSVDSQLAAALAASAAGALGLLRSQFSHATLCSWRCCAWLQALASGRS